MIGSTLSNRYEIAAELGRGGMGVVYRARDPLLNRDVAIKLIPPSLLTADAEQRFQREAQLVAQMDHPAIVSIYDFGRHEDSLFFVMALVQGTNLRAFLRENSVLGDVLEVAIQVAEALEYSHAHGVVHRDIKPENVMVSREAGVGVRVRVMDFGLARAAAESRLTKTGSLVGTLYYLSPEQVAAKGVDGRADIYALGTVLYECLVGQAPFTGESQSVLYRIVHEFPPSPREMGAAIDEELDALVMQCLRKEPGQRPQRGGEVAEALRHYRARLRDSDRDRSVTGLTRSFLAPRPALAPFVGRTKEFGELQQRLNAAVAGECQLVVVSGEPGIGKTRLLDELATLGKARQIRVLHGRSVEQDRAFAYQGFCEVIQEHFRSRDTAASSPTDLSDLAADLLALFPMLSEIPEIREAATGESKLARGATAGPESRTQILELLARTLTRIAGGKPLVLILEDLHGSDVTVEALPYIVTRLGPTPTLVLGSYRTTEVDRRHPIHRVLDGFRGDRRFSAMTLGPFTPSDHRAFVETLVGGSGIPDVLAQRLYAATEGNPFFTRELLRSLLDSGAIARDATGTWSLSGEAGLSAEAMPATIQEVVEQRIQGLPADLREILSQASVIGKSFDSRDLEALAKGADVDDAIDRFVQQGLIEEERESRGEQLRFASGVVRDVLYAALSPRKRRSLHRRCGEILEAHHAGRLDRVLPELVNHFSQGDVPEKAVEYGLRLARASLDAFSAEDAVRAARTALDFLDEEWSGDRAVEGDARTLLARAHRMGGELDAALQEAEAAVRLFQERGQPARSVSALLVAADTAWQTRRGEDARRWAEQGLEAARVGKETESLRQLLFLAATLANLRGDHAKANEYLAEASRLAPESNDAIVSETIVAGGRLVAGLANAVRTIEPAAIEINEEWEIAANVYEPLLATDHLGNLVPRLCESWEAIEGGRAFRLALRRDVRFSDGSGLTAQDVKASIEASARRAGSEPSAYVAIRGWTDHRAGRTEAIEGIAVLGDDALEIRLLEPLPIYPAMLTAVTTAVVRPDPAQQGRSLGTGPFRLATHEPERVVLERNEQYWKGTPPLLDAVEFRSGLSAVALARGFRSGEIDVARDLAPQDLEEILRDPHLRQRLVETPSKNTYFVTFNSRSGAAVREEPVRRALAGVVRTNELVWRALGRFAQPAVCLIPPGMLGHDPGRRRPSLSLEDAKRSLREAGIELPLRLKASVHPLFKDRYGSLLDALLGVWSELGARVEIETADMTAFLQSFESANGLDVLIGRWNIDYDDPDDFSYALFHSRAGVWRNWFSSAETDRILEEARSDGRASVREALYRRFEGVLHEAAAIVPLFHDIDYRLLSPRLRGLSLRSTFPTVNYSELGLAQPGAPDLEARRGQGGTLHVPMASASINTLDPPLGITVEYVDVLPCIYDTLMRETGAGVAPWLAAEMKVEEDGRRYRFRLRDDVRFHDGRRLGARDVRYSFERLLQSASDNRWLFSSIRGAPAVLDGQARELEGFRIHSGTEFTIDVTEPVAFFPALLAFESASIVPEGADPSADLEACVGTGPFRVVAFEPDRRLELERNRNHWRRGYPRCERLVFSFGVPPSDILAGFRAGRFSLATDLFPADAEALRREPGFASRYREAPRLTTYFLALNRHRAPLRDRAVRQRLLQAVDVPKLVRQTLGRLALPASGLIPPGLLGHDAAVAARVDASGSVSQRPISPVVELTAVLHPVFFAGYSAFAKELTTGLVQAGVKVQPLNQNIAGYLDLTANAAADIVIGRWNADYPDPDTFAAILYSQGGFMGGYCSSPELDRLVERGRAETEPALRREIYRQLEEMIAREALLLPLFHEQGYRFARPEIEGLALSSTRGNVLYEELQARA